MINQIFNFNEKEYLINEMIEKNPGNSKQEIRDIVNNTDSNWKNYSFHLEHTKGQNVRCSITDLDSGLRVHSNDIPILAKEYYYKLIDPYLFA